MESKEYTCKQDGCEVFARATADDATLGTWSLELGCSTPYHYMTFVFATGHHSRRDEWQRFLHDPTSDVEIDFGHGYQLSNDPKQCVVHTPNNKHLSTAFGIHKDMCHDVLSALFEELKARKFLFQDTT